MDICWAILRSYELYGHNIPHLYKVGLLLHSIEKQTVCLIETEKGETGQNYKHLYNIIDILNITCIIHVASIQNQLKDNSWA